MKRKKKSERKMKQRTQKQKAKKKKKIAIDDHRLPVEKETFRKKIKELKVCKKKKTGKKVLRTVGIIKKKKLKKKDKNFNGDKCCIFYYQFASEKSYCKIAYCTMMS